MADDKQELQKMVDRQQSTDTEDEKDKDKDKEEAPLPLYLRLLLSSELLGHEASVSFKDMYAVPNLQTLGMPMSLVSLTGLISGPASIILLPLLGWFSDAGTNPIRRRVCIVIMTTLVLILGNITVIIANNYSTSFCQPLVDTSERVFTEMENSSFVGSLQSQNDHTPSVVTMSPSGQDLLAAFGIDSSLLLPPPAESSTMPTSLTKSSGRTTPMIQSSREVASVTSPVNSLYAPTSLTESTSRATGTAEPLRVSMSPKESSPRAALTTASTQSTTASSIGTAPRARSRRESVYNATSSISPSPQATQTREALNGTSSIEFSPQATSSAASSDSTSSTESSPRVASTPTSPEETLIDTAAELVECSRIASGIGMFGYIVVEIGFQTVASNVRTWMLMCSPPSAPTPTLVAGLVMTSLGGMLTSGLSMVDLAAELNLSPELQSSLTVQLTIQAAVNIVLLIIGLSISVPIGLRQLKLRAKAQSLEHQVTTPLIHTGPNITDDFTDKSALFMKQTESTLTGEISRHSSLTVSWDSLSNSDSPTEKKHHAFPEFNENVEEEFLVGSISETQHHSASGSTQTLITYGAIEKETESSISENTSETAQTGGKQDSSKEKSLTDKANNGLCSCRRNWSPRVYMVIVICSSYFTYGAIVISKVSLSDFVSKVIFHGDPSAPPGSEAQDNYQQGLRVSSNGFLLFYVSYLAFSFVQKHVLSCMGYTLEFVTITLAMGVCLVLVSITESLEVYFILSAISGVQRAVFNVIFVAIVSDLVHAEAKRRGDGKGPQLGLGVSMMFATLPLAYCTLYPWVGAVVEMSGVPATPLYLAASCSVVGSVLICILGI